MDTMTTRFCVFCGNLRDPGKGRLGRGGAARTAFPSADRCAEDVHTLEVRFDGVTGDRLDPPPMPRRSLLTSSAGDLAPLVSAHSGRRGTTEGPRYR